MHTSIIAVVASLRAPLGRTWLPSHLVFPVGRTRL